LGIAYVMDCAARPLLVDKRLVRVLEPFCEPFPGFFLYYPSRAQMAPKLRAFVDFFKDSALGIATRSPGLRRHPRGARRSSREAKRDAGPAA